MDGTVSEARRDDGRPVRWGTPDADMMVVGGMARVSDLAGMGVLITSAVLLGMDFAGAAALGAAGDLTALAGAFLAAGGLALVVDGLADGLGTALAAARGGGLAAGDLTVDLLPDDAVGFGLMTVLAVLTAFGAVLVAVLAFTGVAFTS